MLKKKIILITGGTGSFGNAVLKKFLDSGVKEIESLVEMKKSKMIYEKNIIIQS